MDGEEASGATVQSQQGYARRRAFLREVRNAATNWFKLKGYAVNSRYPYILAEWRAWPRNMILPEVAAHIQELHSREAKAGRRLALHKYIHHGLSSQALLFNLLGPLIVNGEFVLLGEVLGLTAEKDLSGRADVELEFENRGLLGEHKGQPTSIDLALMHDGRPVLFVECKFTEAEFGGCSVAAAGACDGRNPANHFGLCYLHRIKRLYWPLMAKHGFIDDALQNERLCVMAQHYQFFREVLFAIEYDRPLVLLTDARNPSFGSAASSAGRGLIPLLLSYVPECQRKRILAVSIQDVVARIKESGRHDWIAGFEKKYGLDPA
jgi:hypothetical protein